jgi:hypothetical protein
MDSTASNLVVRTQKSFAILLLGTFGLVLLWANIKTQDDLALDFKNNSPRTTQGEFLPCSPEEATPLIEEESATPTSHQANTPPQSNADDGSPTSTENTPPQFNVDDDSPTWPPEETLDEFSAFLHRRAIEMPGLEGALEDVLYYNSTTPQGQRLTRYPALPEKLVCMPTKFGYSQAEADQRYNPNKRFRRCSDYKENDFISIKDNHLVLDCPNNDTYVQYMVGSHPEDEALGMINYPINWTHYTQPVDLGRSEFGFGRCVQGGQHAILLNQFNETAAARARNITESIGQSLGVTPRPLTLFLVIFDSVSRQHLYRSLPKTIEYLNTVAEGQDFSIYDFKLNNVQGENTKPNMIPLLYGHKLKFISELLKAYSMKDPEDAWKYLELQQEALWTHYKEMGFVTAFGFDTNWDYLSECTGRSILRPSL